MADRTAAEIFGYFFNTAARMKLTPDVRVLVRKMYWMSKKYDFSPYQMECDEALIQLGLAKMKVDPDYPEDGEVVVYKEIGIRG